MSDSESDSDDNVDESEEEEKDSACWICKKNPIQFAPCGCGCAVYCRKCAMKMATGGRCRKCRKFFVGMRKVC